MARLLHLGRRRMSPRVLSLQAQQGDGRKVQRVAGNDRRGRLHGQRRRHVVGRPATAPRHGCGWGYIRWLTFCCDAAVDCPLGDHLRLSRVVVGAGLVR